MILALARALAGIKIRLRSRALMAAADALYLTMYGGSSTREIHASGVKAGSTSCPMATGLTFITRTGNRLVCARQSMAMTFAQSGTSLAGSRSPGFASFGMQVTHATHRWLG